MVLSSPVVDLYELVSGVRDLSCAGDAIVKLQSVGELVTVTFVGFSFWHSLVLALVGIPQKMRNCIS